MVPRHFPFLFFSDDEVKKQLKFGLLEKRPTYFFLKEQLF